LNFISSLKQLDVPDTILDKTQNDLKSVRDDSVKENER
jgi:hypothetical protein